MKAHLLLAIAIAGCPSSPTNSSPDSAASACTNLARLGCPEGLDPSCATTIRHAANIVDVHAECLAAATTPEAARACGSVTCQIQSVTQKP